MKKPTTLTKNGIPNIFQSNDPEEYVRKNPVILQLYNIQDFATQKKENISGPQCFKCDFSDGHCCYKKIYIYQDAASKINRLKNRGLDMCPIIEPKSIVVQPKQDSFNIILSDFIIHYEDSQKIGQPWEYHEYLNNKMNNPNGGSVILPIGNVNIPHFKVEEHPPAQSQSLQPTSFQFSTTTKKPSFQYMNQGMDQYQVRLETTKKSMTPLYKQPPTQKQPIQYQTTIINPNYDQIVSLVPEMPSFTIKVMILKKSDILEYKNKKNQNGRFFNIDIMDKDNTEITMIFFTDYVEQFYNILQEQKIYVIQHGKIQLNQKQYQQFLPPTSPLQARFLTLYSQNNKYSIIADKSTKISETFNDGLIQPNYANMKKLCEILNAEPDDLVDVIGYVSKKNSIIKVKQGQLEKMSFLMYDDSQVELECTLWGSDIHKYTIEIDQPIIIKAAKVGVYQNIKNLSVTKHSMVTVGGERLLEIPAFQELNTWKQANNGAITLTRYAVSDRLDRLWNIQELLEFCSYKEGNMDFQHWSDVKGSIVNQSLSGNFYYTSCDICQKKVQQDQYGQWNCPEHNQVANPQTKYIVRVQVRDSSGEVWVLASDQISQKIFPISADEAKLFVDSGRLEELKTLFSGNLYQTWNFKILSYVESYQGSNSLKHKIVKIDEPNPRRNGELFYQQIIEINSSF